MTSSRILPLILALLAAVLLSAGCGDDNPGPEAANWRNDLFLKEMELPTMYLTAQTGKKVIAPASKGVFVDEESGEVCWPAMACLNPNCPGKGLDGEPYLFIIPLPGGPTPTKVVTVDPSQAAPKNGEGHCPQCLTVRRLSNEHPTLTQKYVNWVRPHVLPEAAEQMKKIEAERMERIEAKRRR